MSTNPLRKSDRILQTKKEKGDLRQSVSLFDIDYAMMSYLEDTALPTLDDNGKSLKIPVIYGNSERWNGARRQGVYRDGNGKIQLPLMMIRRTSIAKDDAMPMQNRHVTYQGITKYSKDNKYDRFTLLGGATQPKYEIYKIQMPEYVELTYDCMVWTSYIEHLNSVIEQLQYTGTYWGDKNGFQFRTSLGDFNVVNEVGDGTERVNRIEFSLSVKAHLLPEKFDGEDNVKKSFSTKRVVVSTETDVTANGRLESILTTPSAYYDNKDLIDFLSLNNSEIGSPVVDNTILFSAIKLIEAPSQLSSVITTSITAGGKSYDIKVYINGVRYYQTTHFTVVISSNSLTLNFISANLGFSVTPIDEITITGKFINIV
jgi:hypothetical protein